MCERTCPDCGSTDHFEQYGVVGFYIGCSQCAVILAWRADEEAAPLDCADPEDWARERRGVRPGAEARDPGDDEMFH